MGILEGRERTGLGMIKDSDSVSYIHSQTAQERTTEFKKEKALTTLSHPTGHMKKAAMVFLNYIPVLVWKHELIFTSLEMFKLPPVLFLYLRKVIKSLSTINDKRDNNKTREISLFLQWFRPFYKWINYLYWQVERNTKKYGKHLKS